jgi:uncharacterized membrane protein YqjE
MTAEFQVWGRFRANFTQRSPLKWSATKSHSVLNLTFADLNLTFADFFIMSRVFLVFFVSRDFLRAAAAAA